MRDFSSSTDNQLHSSKTFFPLDQLPSIKRNAEMRKAVGLVNNVSSSDITVLITGESGVGKEIFAQSLHQNSLRKTNRLVGLNCASVPANLLEAELFGYEKGAFTGAIQQRKGKLELAQNGTLLLDELSEMDLNLQTKLLRVIQEREMYRVGGQEKIKLNFRLVATTNRDLKAWVQQGQFREDLYYRVNVISIHIPPLRQRLEDVPVLAQFILQKFNQAQPQASASQLSPQAIEQLCRYPWPGNIRELENILLRSAYLSRGETIHRISFDEHAYENEVGSSEVFDGTLRDMEKKMIFHALQRNGGNRVHASRELGISVRTLRNKLRLYREESAHDQIANSSFENQEVLLG